MSSHLCICFNNFLLVLLFWLFRTKNIWLCLCASAHSTHTERRSMAPRSWSVHWDSIYFAAIGSPHLFWSLPVHTSIQLNSVRANSHCDSNSDCNSFIHSFIEPYVLFIGRWFAIRLLKFQSKSIDARAIYHANVYEIITTPSSPIGNLLEKLKTQLRSMHIVQCTTEIKRDCGFSIIERSDSFEIIPVDLLQFNFKSIHRFKSVEKPKSSSLIFVCDFNRIEKKTTWKSIRSVWSSLNWLAD